MKKRDFHKNLHGVALSGAKQPCKIFSCFTGGKRKAHCILWCCSCMEAICLCIRVSLVAVSFHFVFLKKKWCRCILGVMLSWSV